MFRGFVSLVLACLVASAASGQTVKPSPPPVEDYGKLPAMGLLRLSPSGERYAYAFGAAGKRHVLIATTPDNKIIGNVPIDGVKVVGLDWAGDSHLLITTSVTARLSDYFSNSKNEVTSVSVLNLDTKKMVGVFANGGRDRVASKIAGKYGATVINGKWYGFFGAYTYDKNGFLGTAEGYIFPDLYRVDLDTGAFQLVSCGLPDLTGWLVRPDGALAARSYYDDKTGNWKITSGHAGEILLASGRYSLGGAEIIGFGKTPDTVVIAEPTDNGWVEEELPLAGGKPLQAVDDETVADEMFDPITHLWVGYRQESDSQAVKLFDPAKDAEMRAAETAFAGYRIELLSYSADFKRLILGTDAGDDSGTIWFINFADGKGKAAPLGMYYPTIDPASVGPVRMIDYKAADGLAMHAVLTLPPGGGKNLPVVVMPHGGPVDRDYPGFDYWAQAFASRGYAVLQPNFRGSSGYGAAFREAGFGEWGRKMQTDVSDGLAELVRQGVADPKRACIVGWSYGGYAALAGVTVQQHLYRCAVSMAGIGDLGVIYDDAGTEGSEKRYWKKFLGSKSDWTNAQIRAISPVYQASHADAPILLIHGQDDTVVAIEQSQAMARALRDAGKPVEFLTLPGADHWLLEEDARVAMLKASVAFVMKYDPPDPAPSAVAAK